MHKFISGRMRGVRITEIQQKVMKEKELEDIDQPLSQEEQWRKKKTEEKKNPKLQSLKG